MDRLCLLVVMFVMSLISGRRIHNPWEETDSNPTSRSSRSRGVCPDVPINCGRRPGFESAGDGLDKIIGSTGDGLDKIIGGTGDWLDKIIGGTGDGLDKIIGGTGDWLDKIIGSTGDGLDKIIGGTDAQRGEIPWIARVEKPVWYQGRFYFTTLCAGVIINPYWILTAALCTSSIAAVSSRRIVVGNLNVNVNEEGQQVFNVSRFLPHLSFRGTEGVSPVLKKVQLAYESINVCGGYVYQRQFLTERMFCAGERHGSTDACAADIGGPAVYKSEGRYVLFGIISHGTFCHGPNTKVVMVKVPTYRNWVLETIRDNSPDPEEFLPDDNITSSSATCA